jgi:hypothetical protein
MSAYTTLTVTRSAAIAKLAELRHERLPTNASLEAELDARLRHTLYNFEVVDDWPRAFDNIENDDPTLQRLTTEDD